MAGASPNDSDNERVPRTDRERDALEALVRFYAEHFPLGSIAALKPSNGAVSLSPGDRVIAERRLVSHARAAEVLRKLGYSQTQIQDALRGLPDPFDTERYGDELVRRGITMGQLMERMGGSP